MPASGQLPGVGVAVGVAVGADVGDDVGDAVGEIVAAGVTVGVAVGLAAGVTVGVAVEVAVGVAVGIAVGVAVGVPPPALSISMWPPDCLAKPYAMRSPNPVPPLSFLVVKNGSNNRSQIASGIPGPQSQIAMTA